MSEVHWTANKAVSTLGTGSGASEQVNRLLGHPCGKVRAFPIMCPPGDDGYVPRLYLLKNESAGISFESQRIRPDRLSGPPEGWGPVAVPHPRTETRLTPPKRTDAPE